VRRRRWGAGKPRVVCGTMVAGAQGLAPFGWHITTAFGARVNLPRRPHGAAVGRRGRTLGKGEEG